MSFSGPAPLLFLLCRPGAGSWMVRIHCPPPALSFQAAPLAWASGPQCGPTAVLPPCLWDKVCMLPTAAPCLPHYTTSCLLTRVAFCALSLLFPGMSYKGQPGRLPHWGAPVLPLQCSQERLAVPLCCVCYRVQGQLLVYHLLNPLLSGGTENCTNQDYFSCK